MAIETVQAKADSELIQAWGDLLREECWEAQQASTHELFRVGPSRLWLTPLSATRTVFLEFPAGWFMRITATVDLVIYEYLWSRLDLIRSYAESKESK